MRIAFILNPTAMCSGDSNGVKNQARTWKSCLEGEGHNVDEISVWDNYQWEKYDIIHIFGFGLWLPNLVQSLYKFNKNIVISPIIDSNRSYVSYKLASNFGSSVFRLYSPNYALKESLKHIKAVFVRSVYESKFISLSLNFDSNNIFKVPVGITLPSPEKKYKKKKFCFHVSSIYQKRKNVVRLINAAQKYHFDLVLAGAKGSEEQFKKIKDAINGSKYINVLGFIDKEELLSLYMKARVFALPSLYEGVGIVALDAAAYGCDIVITERGGPKEYYNNMAKTINPESVDEIGQSILEFLNGETFQPDLQKHVIENYSQEAITNQIINSYQKIMYSNTNL